MKNNYKVLYFIFVLVTTLLFIGEVFLSIQIDSLKNPVNAPVVTSAQSAWLNDAQPKCIEYVNNTFTVDKVSDWYVHSGNDNPVDKIVKSCSAAAGQYSHAGTNDCNNINGTIICEPGAYNKGIDKAYHECLEASMNKLREQYPPRTYTETVCQTSVLARVI